jgi:hypothetical protein
MLAYQLGLSERALGRSGSAIRAMKAASEAPEFSPDQRHNARFYLAGFYFDAGDRGQATRLLQGILKEDPSHDPYGFDRRMMPHEDPPTDVIALTLFVLRHPCSVRSRTVARNIARSER